MTYILTSLKLNIIAQSETPWNTPGEYEDDCFMILICEIPEGKEIDWINSVGTVSPPEQFEVQGKEITCDHIYRSPDIDFKDIPEVD